LSIGGWWSKTEIVLVDEFVVPEESMSSSSEETGKIQEFVSGLPGFVEGYVFEKKSGQSRYNVLTIAVWKDPEAMEAAMKSAQAHFQKIGFNPGEVMKRLKVEGVRSTYTRHPYSR
jgi:heme-degrading monooxygenase HmoA